MLELMQLLIGISISRYGGPRVAVVPFASAREDRGLGSVEMWREAGAPSVTLVPEDEGARSLLESADIIWLGGGSQSRLMAFVPVC